MFRVYQELRAYEDEAFSLLTPSMSSTDENDYWAYPLDFYFRFIKHKPEKARAASRYIGEYYGERDV